ASSSGALSLQISSRAAPVFSPNFPLARLAAAPRGRAKPLAANRRFNAAARPPRPGNSFKYGACPRRLSVPQVRYVGVSNETSLGVSEFSNAARAAGLPKIQTIQNAYSLLVRVPFETDLAETCRHHHVSLLAYSPLAGGMLSAKYNHRSDAELQSARFNLFPGYMARYKMSAVQEAVGEYEKVAVKHGMTPAALALAWCKS
ncbi:Protein tas, partial [Tetrabaena socialis]